MRVVGLGCWLIPVPLLAERWVLIVKKGLASLSIKHVVSTEPGQNVCFSRNAMLEIFIQKFCLKVWSCQEALH